jgi:hypothetical protein
MKKTALGKENQVEELIRCFFFRGSELTLEKGWGLQMPNFFIKNKPLTKSQDQKKLFVTEILESQMSYALK